MSATTGKLAVNISVPVLKNGQLVGVIGGSCSLEKLSEIVGQLTFMESGFGYLLDENGIVIAHPQTNLISNLNVGTRKIFQEKSGEQKVLDQRLTELFLMAKQGRSVEGDL